jgi:hypothetical protein
LLCGLALGWGRKPPKPDSLDALRDSFPEAVSYPAVRPIGPVTRSDATMLNSLANAGMDSLTRDQVSRQWWLSNPHPFVESLVPGAQLYRCRWRRGRVLESETYFALFQGKLYGAGHLNYLLLDAGFSFDTSQMLVTAKAAVFFAVFGWQRPDTSARRQWSDMPTPPPSDPLTFPAVAFLSVKRGVRRYPSGYVAQGVYLDCVIGTLPNTVFVEFYGSDEHGRAVLNRVMGTGINFMLIPLILPDTEPKLRRGAIQHDEPRDGWTIGVVGEAWVENDGTSDHYFMAVQTNGQPTGDSLGGISGTQYLIP